MSTHKHIDKICCVVLALTLILSTTFIFTGAFGAEAKEVSLGYENRLFDTSRVHTVDIVMNDWDGFIEGCTDEEYASCSVVIDGEAYKNVAIRAKGNTSLSNVQSMNSDRYSFKIEFDHYDNTNTYHGLDKLCLNNIIQDNTYMKDYLTYQMMNEFGVASPLCSYANITVNGEDWGLYLAVEAVEESFLVRNYGTSYGELYKPDSLSMGGGRGNGKDFDMGNLEDMFGDAHIPNMGESGFPGVSDDTIPEMPSGEIPTLPEGETMPDMGGGMMPGTDNQEIPEGGMQMPGMGGDMGGMSMGSDDVSLIYSDENYSSYSNIFDNAKTDITDADKDRLIASLKAMNEKTDIEGSVNIEDVIRYFVVHNFVVNFDSYTGSMIHNYYLYEEDGQLSMIPWDYNLAFGGFQSATDATSLVNYPIDSPVSGGTVDSRPMLAWILADEEYTEMYHSLFSSFIADYFESGKFAEMIDSVKEMISPYVEKDPSKFCTYDEFVIGIDTLKAFCLLRAESVLGQLDGTIGSTSEAQIDKTNFVNADGLSISSMGTMGNTMGGDMPGGNGDGQKPTMPNGEIPAKPNGQEIPSEETTEGVSAMSFTLLSSTTEEKSDEATEKTEDTENAENSENEQSSQQIPNMNGGMGGFGGNMQNGNAQAGMQKPGNMQGGNMNSSQGGSIGSANTGISISSDIAMLIVSVVVLAGGLIFALSFKRRK